MKACEHDDIESICVDCLKDEIERLKTENNRLELKAEDGECAMMYLDDLGVLREVSGNELSLVGRIKIIIQTTNTL